jgi:hypothetical protein
MKIVLMYPARVFERAGDGLLPLFPPLRSPKTGML